MRAVWDRIEDHVFSPYRTYLMKEDTQLKAEHHSLTGRPFMGWLDPTLIERNATLQVTLKKLDWDQQLARQAVSKLVSSCAHEGEAMGRLPKRIFPSELWNTPGMTAFMDDMATRSTASLSPEIVAIFDHYLGMRIVLSH